MREVVFRMLRGRSVYYTGNAPGNGNDGFGLISRLLPHTGPGTQLLYNPGTQSALIPVDFSNFNPGTYQSVESGFNTVLTVNLTVEAVPEPSTLALAVGAAIGAALTRRKARALASKDGYLVLNIDGRRPMGVRKVHRSARLTWGL